MALTQERYYEALFAGITIATHYISTMQRVEERLNQALEGQLPPVEFARLLRSYCAEAQPAIAISEALLRAELKLVRASWKHNQYVANWKRRKRGAEEKTSIKPNFEPLLKPKLTPLQQAALENPNQEIPFDDNEMFINQQLANPNDYLDGNGNLKPGAFAALPSQIDPDSPAGQLAAKLAAKYGKKTQTQIDAEIKAETDRLLGRSLPTSSLPAKSKPFSMTEDEANSLLGLLDSNPPIPD